MSYWRNINKDPEINRSEDLIRDAISELETETNHIIKGTFSKISYTKAGFRTKVTALEKIFNLPMWMTPKIDDEEVKVEVPDEELEGKENILFEHNLEVYKLEIFTERYRFRIFELVKSIAFPVRIVLDEGISEELDMKSPAREISSNDDMERFLRDVLRSRKVTNVVNQLMVLAKTDNDDEIIEYLKKTKGATVREVANEMKWSQSLAYDKLCDMEENGKVEVIAEGNKAHIYKVKYKNDDNNV